MRDLGQRMHATIGPARAIDFPRAAVELSFQSGKCGRYQSDTDYKIQNVNIAHNTFAGATIKMCPRCPVSNIRFADNAFDGTPIFKKVPTDGFTQRQVAFNGLTRGLP